VAAVGCVVEGVGVEMLIKKKNNLFAIPYKFCTFVQIIYDMIYYRKKALPSIPLGRAISYFTCFAQTTFSFPQTQKSL
jgi:hypothetical protein